jgi:hypothetical protein
MPIDKRRELYQKIEGHRTRPLIVYVTSKRDGLDASMATDALPYLMDQLDRLPAEATSIDFMIASLGGDPMVAWRIMSLIRQRVDKVYVLVPQSAYSAATLVALGADEIVMHPNSHLGPVDMQITTTGTEGKRRKFSTEDIGAFLDFVKDRLGINDQRHLRRLFEITCREVGSLGVGFTSRSSKLAVSLGERLLSFHMNDDGPAAPKAKPGEGKIDLKRKSVVESLSRHFHSHAYPVSRKEAIEINLPIAERDPTLEYLMWQAWLDLEEELKERKPFSPIIELLNSNQAAKLLSPVPQLDVPGNVPSPMVQADLDAVSKAPTVDPVSFEHVDALMESSRLAHRGVTKGKILASRLPDLNLQYNMFVSFRGWEDTTVV